MNTETLRKVEFEKVVADNIELMVSKNISEPLTYTKAIDWCKAEGGRLPTIQELEALYKEGDNVRNSFDEKIIWSSSEYYGNVWAYDFGKGKKVLCSKEDKLDSASVVTPNISDTANTRTVYIIE